MKTILRSLLVVTGLSAALAGTAVRASDESLQEHAAPTATVPARVSPNLVVPGVDRRGEDQTFLTFPEWFLVFSSAEYAQFVRDHAPDEFCFWGHIGQFWRAYHDVIHETVIRHEPTNWGYHLMIVVIGVSTTVEYAAHSAYETVIGRLAGATARGRTPEEDFGARAAQEYVDFIRYRPWYEFDFLSRLKRLWSETSFLGPNMIRKWERKYALTTEYVLKALYGWLITKGSDSVYDPIRPTTLVVVDRWPLCAQAPSGVSIIRSGDNGAALLSIPRYQGFTTPAVGLAHCGVQFREIAGNRSDVLVSVIGDVCAQPLPTARVMTRQPIITNPGRERIVLIVPIGELATLLRSMDAGSTTLEHVFDY